MKDAELRQLAAWSRDRDAVLQAQREVREARAIAKKASRRLAETQQRRADRCPIPLDDVAYRLWSRTYIIDDEVSCWEFRGGRKPVRGEEYGLFRLGDKTVGAHRVAYLLTHGVLPEVARHTCDNPPCVRPNHLIDGTHADNMRDRKERGRYGYRDQRGGKNPATTLTDADVLEMRRLARSGATHREIADLFGVSRHNAMFPIVGRSFSHLDEIEPPVRRPVATLTTTDLPDLRRERERGDTYAAIATRRGVTGSAVRQFLVRHAGAVTA